MNVAERLQRVKTDQHGREGERAEKNRAMMPGTASVVDSFLAFFGEDVKVTFASENGRTVGKKDEEVGFSVGKMVLCPEAIKRANEANKKLDRKYGKSSHR